VRRSPLSLLFSRLVSLGRQAVSEWQGKEQIVQVFSAMGDQVFLPWGSVSVVRTWALCSGKLLQTPTRNRLLGSLGGESSKNRHRGATGNRLGSRGGASKPAPLTFSLLCSPISVLAGDQTLRPVALCDR